MPSDDNMEDPDFDTALKTAKPFFSSISVPTSEGPQRPQLRLQGLQGSSFTVSPAPSPIKLASKSEIEESLRRKRGLPSSSSSPATRSPMARLAPPTSLHTRVSSRTTSTALSTSSRYWTARSSFNFNDVFGDPSTPAHDGDVESFLAAGFTQFHAMFESAPAGSSGSGSMSPADSTSALPGSSPTTDREHTSLLHFLDKLVPRLTSESNDALEEGHTQDDPLSWPIPSPDPSPSDDLSAVPEDFLINKEIVLDFWLCLTEKERRLLVYSDKAMCLKGLKAGYANETCQCDGCRRRRLTVEANIETRYDEFADELESFAGVYFQRVQKAVASGQPDPSIDKMYPDSLLVSNLSVEATPESGAPVSEASPDGFFTLGKNLSLGDDIRDVATAFLHDDFPRFMELAEHFAQVNNSTCEFDSFSDHHTSLKDWSDATKDRERQQAFSIFATKIFEQRVLTAYQEFQARRDILQNFRSISTATSSREAVSVTPILEHATRLFGQEDIILENTQLPDTSGAFSDLYRGDHHTLGKVALKRLRFNAGDHGAIVCFLAEARIWQGLRHPYLLPFLGLLVEEHTQAVSLVSPFMENGSLPRYLISNPMANRIKFICELASGLAYLHKVGVVHGDVKGNNVLVSASLSVQLADFGLSKIAGCATNPSLAGVGSIRWQAPEIMNEGTKTFKTDVYAFGLTIFEILSGLLPFHTMTAAAAIVTAVIIRKERPPTRPLVSRTGVSYGHLWQLAARCWAEDPEVRPTMADAFSATL